MRVISLFSGTGAFELGFERNGFRVVGQCEFDQHAQAVLKRHWPDVPLHDDIKTLEGDAFGPAEVVVWGSPCQGLSLAGRRAGLEDERSGLFTEGIRFIRELRHATDDQYPRFSVWENVPGALSSATGRDFRAVLEAFLEAEVPMPRSGKWANAGVVRGNGREVAWRVLDSQHFGVAQRRRRVFVVTDFGGHGAAEILFEREGVPGHPSQSREARPSATTHPRGGAKGVLAESGVVQALTGGLGSGGPDAQHAQAGWLVPIGFSWQNSGNEGLAMRVDGVGPLDVSQTKAIAFALRGRAEGNVPEESGEQVSALRGSSGGSTRDMVATRYAVRRLTPRETERLQGMPDDWTEFGHYYEGFDRERLWNAKTRTRPKGEEAEAIVRKIADTHRYRLCGNAVSVPVAEWIAKRLAQTLTRPENPLDGPRFSEGQR